MANMTKPSLLWGETDSVLHEACPLALKDNRKCVPLKDKGMTMNIVLIKNDKQICQVIQGIQGCSGLHQFKNYEAGPICRGCETKQTTKTVFGHRHPHAPGKRFQEGRRRGVGPIRVCPDTALKIIILFKYDFFSLNTIPFLNII